jgi:hypothetical protein
MVPYSAKVKTPLRGGLQTFGHYGTRVRRKNLAPQRGLKFGIPRYNKFIFYQELFPD